MSSNNDTAVYTTIYPEALRYFDQWQRSLLKQTTGDFTLWIGLDGVSSSYIKARLDPGLSTVFHESAPGDTPISLRNNALCRLVESHERVILVDSDDILERSRIEKAEKLLEHSDVVGCGMKIINESGEDTGLYFGPSGAVDFRNLLFRYNVFGLTNTAFKSTTLKKMLPVPLECIAMDWYLASYAACLDLTLTFDNCALMRYRQYSSNTAKVLPPYSKEDISKAVNVVLSHYRCLLERAPELGENCRRKLENAQKRTVEFAEKLDGSKLLFEKYLLRLNTLPPSGMWWTQVCHPDIELDSLL